jgi:hypothetical protein
MKSGQAAGLVGVRERDSERNWRFDDGRGVMDNVLEVFLRQLIQDEKAQYCSGRDSRMLVGG